MNNTGRVTVRICIIIALLHIVSFTLISCSSGGSGGGAGATLQSIVVSPANPSIPKLVTSQFAATGTYSDGSSQDITASVTWTSDTPATATINSSGLATGVAVGTSTITATSGTISGSTTLTVTAATLQALSVNPSSPVVVLGRTMQLTAMGTFSDGSSLDITGSVTWNSAQTPVATVDATGLATGVSLGMAVITATSGVISGSATLSVVTLQSITVPRFAYVTNISDNTVSIFTVDASTGSLRHNGYIASGTTPLSVAVDPAGRFAYTANYGSNNVSVYTINPSTGVLAAGTAVAAELWPYSITVDPTGRFAYVANEASHTISAYTINQTTGDLTGVGTAPAVQNPKSVAVDPTGKFAYAANYFGDNVSVYTINQTTGALTAGTPVAAGANPNSVTVDPAGKFAYIANYGSGTISAYTINATTGALTAVAGSPFGAGTNPYSVSVDPLGKFAYVANAGSGTVTAYTISDTTGALTSAGTVTAGSSPRSVTVDPSGKFAYVANYGTNDIMTYTINTTTGALTASGTVRARSGSAAIAMTGSTNRVTYRPKIAYVANAGANTISAYTIGSVTGDLTSLTSVATGSSPNSVAIDPSGRFAYAVNRTSNDVSAYSLLTTGVPVPIDADAAAGGMQMTIAAGTTPLSIAVDPSGRFVYAANVGTGVADPGTVSAYRIDTASGALSAVAGSPFAAGNGPDAVVVDPAGRFVYVANYGWPGSGTVSAYTIDAASGALTPVAGSPFAASGGSDAITVDHSGRFVYVANLLVDTISAYSIDAVSGALTPIDADAVTAGSQNLSLSAGRIVSLTVNPARGYVYFATACGTVWAYSIDTTNGALTRIDSNPGGLCFASRDAPNSIAVDPSGRYVFSANYSLGDSISSNNIDATTGAITPVNGSPFAAGPSARAVVTSGIIE